MMRLLVAAGLGVDAAIHLVLAPAQPPASPGVLSQVTLFYAESAAAIIAALLVLIIPRRWTYLLAFLVAASALGAVLLYRYVNIGPLGPIPNMYEPDWDDGKLAVTIAEAIATLAAAAGVLVPHRRARHARAASPGVTHSFTQ
jgi:glucan phosphoethanolaminetransferase (alkaline phosphatase superfamily)